VIVEANPGSWARIEGRVELLDDVVVVDGRPLAEVLRSAFAADPTDDVLGRVVIEVTPAREVFA
jgi:hypothetical protein